MKDYHYISTGAQTKMYTLRHKFDEVVWFTNDEGKTASTLVERDWHIQNLSIDADKAKLHAAELGFTVATPEFLLQDIERSAARSAEAIAAAKLAFEEHLLTTQRMKLEGEISLIKDGLFPFGKNEGVEFKTLESRKGSGFIAYFMKQGKLANASATLKFMSEYLIANFPEIAKFTFYESNGEYFGEVGDKVKSVDVFVVERFSFESAYGRTTIIKFLTPRGELLNYTGTSPIELYQGEKVKVNFTVKQHLVYRDEAQTKIIRVKEAK